MTRFIEFEASNAAAEALQLDDASLHPSIVSLGRNRYRATEDDARSILADAEDRGWGGGWDQEFYTVRPCRAVAARIKKALGEDA